jgi:hypothetical protein
MRFRRESLVELALFYNGNSEEYSIRWRTMRKQSSGNIRTRIVLNASGGDPEPRRGRRFDFLFSHTLAPLRLNGPYFVPRGLPAFALFTILLFHSRAKSADSESRLQTV